MLKMMDLEDQLKICRAINQDLKKEVSRLSMLLNGENVIMNSLGKSKDCTSTDDSVESNK
jgi:hypothetical protein